METAKTLWGRVVSLLRRQRQIALHVACGDIVDVSEENGTFTINCEENYLYDIISSVDNIKILTNAFNNLGKDYKIKVVKKDKPEDKIQKDKDKLAEIFGNKLIIGD